MVVGTTICAKLATTQGTNGCSSPELFAARVILSSSTRRLRASTADCVSATGGIVVAGVGVAAAAIILT